MSSGTGGPGEPDRRQFMRRGGGVVWGAWLSTNFAACRDASEYARGAVETGPGFDLLGDGEARAVEAICATLIPSDGTPGATEAGAVYFIDRVLGTFESGNLTTVRDGLARLSARVEEGFPTGTAFADLAPEERISVLKAVEEEDGGFFGVMRYLTICGTFSHPNHGGNRDLVGWELVGMDVQNAYQPPFGYYDRPFHEGGTS